MAALYIWDRSISLRLDYDSDLERITLKPQKNVPTVFLGRSKGEVQRLAKTFSKFLDGYTASAYECFSNDNYPWCFITYSFVNDVSNFRILSWGPQFATQGSVPNIQPDGTGTLWVRVSGDEELGAAQVYFGGKPAASTVVGLGNISATIPATILDTPGTVDVSVKQAFAGRIFPVGTFAVDAQTYDLRVLNWGPQSTSGGEVPNLQPDGGAGVWIQVSDERDIGDVQVLFDGYPAKSTAVSSGLIAASVPAGSFREPGKKPVSIRQVITGKLFAVGSFVVEK